MSDQDGGEHSSAFGGTGLLRNAGGQEADDAIDTIILEIDSPGGFALMNQRGFFEKRLALLEKEKYPDKNKV